MREYIYGNQEIKLIQHLLNNTPEKIWYNFVYYIFDYGSYHLRPDCMSEQAKTQNDYDEAIIAELSRKDEKYDPNEHSVVVCENKSIENIYIVRAFLYFSTFRNYTKSEKLSNRFSYKLKSFFKLKTEPLDKIISETTGVGAEYVCHPKSEEVNDVDLEYSNLLDVGLLIEIENRYLRAFLKNNGFGFHIRKEKYFFETDDLKEDVEQYELIKVERNKNAC